MIRHGGWDFVVLQEIYTASQVDFETYAALFDDEVRRAGSRTVLFATASVTHHYNPAYQYPGSFRRLNDMQIAFGRERGIPTAAAGYAWMRYLDGNVSEERLLDLYDEDRGHPGIKGSYIYACLLYAVLTGLTPSGLTSDFIGKNGAAINEGEARRMQEAAWIEFSEAR